MTKCAWVLGVAAVLVSSEVCAQENPPQPPAAAQQTKVENTVKRYRIGVQGGVGIDPEILDVGVHASFGPIFSDRVAFRPVFEIGFGEVTTLIAFNFDLLYTFAPSTDDPSAWRPYIGAGPQFGLVHQGFSTEDSENVDAEVGGEDVDETGGRFDFSNTDFNGGLNFIVGMKRANGTFFEMKTTAWGASNIRLLIGFNF
ncbi:MAG TPA: hypothetical protein VFP27_02395 [Mycobacterium sp.]|nr:hypothetical protein [Mycobacterium sp.]